MHDEIQSSPENTVIQALKRGISRFAGRTQVAAILGRSDQRLKLYGVVELFEPYRKDVKDVLQRWPEKPNQFSIPCPPGQYGAGDLDDRFLSIWRVSCSPAEIGGIVSVWLLAASERLKSLVLSQAYSDGDYSASPSIGADIEFYAQRAVASYVRELRLKRDPQLALYSFQINYILGEIARISLATEEGVRPTGTLAFVDCNGPKIDKSTPESVIKFAELCESIPLSNHKHLAKLLQIVREAGCLLGDQSGVSSIIRESPSDALIARFEEGTVEIAYDTTVVCRVRRGEIVYASSAKDPAPESFVSNAADSCKSMIKTVLGECRKRHRGCTIVVSNEKPNQMSGHQFQTPVSNGEELLSAMATVDGALWLDFKGALYGFGLLLDGDVNPDKEDRSRGSRYNSAVRFSPKIPTGYIIVASEDGPITVFQKGLALYSDPLAEPLPPPSLGIDQGISLEEWISQSDAS